MHLDQVVAAIGGWSSKVIGRHTPGSSRVSGPRKLACHAGPSAGTVNTAASVRSSPISSSGG
jgi:hypothetical protein